MVLWCWVRCHGAVQEGWIERRLRGVPSRGPTATFLGGPRSSTAHQEGRSSPLDIVSKGIGRIQSVSCQ